MSQDVLVTKPSSGHWTDAYPELGRGPVSLEDCVSTEFYEKEREHVFKKTWLYVGRVERVPKSGSYFTRELRFLDTSIIIVRGKDDVIRAFHNICPHRGNKMLWEDDPFEEVQGRAPVLYCRFHGWRYKLDGSLHAATRKDLLLDFDAESCRVPAIQCEVWEGSSSSTSTRTTPSRCGPTSASWPTASKAIRLRGHTRCIGSKSNCSATGRFSSTDSPKVTTGRICTRPRSAPSPRRRETPSTSRTRSPTRWPTGSRVRTGCFPSPASRRRRRRTPSPLNA